MPLLLLLLLCAPASAATVTMDGARWQSLQPDVALPDDPRRPHATDRTVALRVDEHRVHLRATWRIDPGEQAWFAEEIVGFDAAVESVRWNGRPAKAHAVRGGYVVLERLSGAATLELVASVPRGKALRLLDATRGTATLAGEGLVLGGDAVATAEGWRLPPGAIEIEQRPPPERGALIDAHVGIGLTVEDGAVDGRGRIELVPRRGRVDSVALALSGIGPDLTIRGRDVADVDRSGDTVTVRLRSAVERTVQLDLRWTTTLPSSELATVTVPTIRLSNVHRTETTLQLARSGEREVIPRITGDAVASRDLPAWGHGLVAGQPTAAFRGPRGSLDLLRYEPADGPPAIVDVAEYSAAATEGGVTIVQARYAVRADRAAALEVTPPPGCTLLAVRVDGRAEPPSTTAAGAWRVPLPRSVESVDGLLSFPVELAWLHTDTSWTRREHRELPLPSLDAPVAVQRATIHLPPGFAALAAEDQDRRVDGFSRGAGIRYGFAQDADGEAKKEAADALYGAAVQAWKSNEFDEAQNYLDGLEELGAANDDVSRLQRNLDVVEGRDEADGVAARRVLDQAKARGKKKRRLYDSKVRAAEERTRAGDKASAERLAKEALSLNFELQKLEQSESVELEDADEDLRALAGELIRDVEETAAALETDIFPLHEASAVDQPARPVATDAARAPPIDSSTAQTDLDRLVDGPSGLDKFDYGDPDVDVWEGRGDVIGYGGFGSRGSGYGGGGFGRGSISGAVKKPAVTTVLAASRSVPIPRIGEALLFQRLLLPAGAPQTLSLRARRAGGPS